MSSSNNCDPNWKRKALECHAKWGREFCLWKSFNVFQSNLLNGYIGLALFGYPSKDEQDLSNIWRQFKRDEQEIIVKIADKFKFGFGPGLPYVAIGHTYLYLDSDTTVCVFRQLKCTNEIIFIDSNGRVYKSWEHFHKTNILPDCRYIAPDDGLHKVKQTLLIYKSPAADLGRVLQTTDTMAAGCSLGAVALMGLAMAPFTATVLGVVGTVYGVGRSIGVLNDRSEHEESIGLDNAQSVISWATIGASAITGVSNVALSRSAQIVGKSGNFANVTKAALKGLSYAALTANVCNFGTYVYCLQQKVASGEELTALDLMEGCVNVFLIAGAVSNTRQMNKYINSLETAPKTSGARLSRTAKRRLQRLRAKQRANGGNVPMNADVKQVTTLEENIPNWGLSFVLNAGQQFLNKHINIQQIYYKCLEILNTCNDFRLNKIGLAVFASNMMNHVQNLFILVTDSLEATKSKVKSLLKQYFSYSYEVPDSVANLISLSVENTITTVKQLDDTLIEDEEVQESSENESKLNYEIIFNAVKNRIPQTTQTNEIICSFGKELSSLISEIKIELNDNYEEFVSKNIESLGKTEADKLFSETGIKTFNDFANLNFERVMESKNDDVKINHSIANEETMQKLLILYKTLFSKVTPQETHSELGALATCKLLEKSVTEVLNPLGEKFKSAMKLFELNAPFVGQEKAKSMVFTSLKVNHLTTYRFCVMNNSTLFDLAAETLCLNKIARELSEALKDEKETNKISSQLSDEDMHIIVLYICDKLYQKVKHRLNVTSNSEREKSVKNCYIFSMEKFVKLIKTKEEEENIKTSSFLKLQNEQFFNRQKFARVYRKVCEMRKDKTVTSVFAYFIEEEHLTSLAEEYIAKNKVTRNYCIAAPVCTEINEEDGVRIFSIDEGSYSSLSAYERRAASLFDLNEYQMELIKWENGCVILKCGYKYVVFHNVDVKSMIVMEMDTSKEHVSN